jgi:rhodanese-related sulfurtransferase/ABC-type phosphate/phosphonate transport system substrate-binding protein
LKQFHRAALGAFALAFVAAICQGPVLAAPAAAPDAPLRVLVNPGDSSEQSRVAAYLAWKSVLEQVLRKPGAPAPNIALSMDATADLGATRSRTQDIFIAPAHVVGSAVRYGYHPVVGLQKPVQAVLVVPKDSGIDSLAAAKGKRLGLPLQDSVVTYLVRGEVNAANTSIKQHFASVYDTRYQDALLQCLHLRRCDVVAVEKAVYERWLAAGEPLKSVMESKAVPGLSVAVRDGARVPAEALHAMLSESSSFAALLRSEKAASVTHKADDFKYVSTLGYFTPRTLAGASVVDAKSVAQLLQGGATYVDTRTDAEFKAGHVPGAKLVPYVEKSHKEADFDAALDAFDVSRLGADRDAALVFACNGPECWKSFKASHAAIKAGYRKVYWFRGGFPEWRSSGLKFDAAAAQ